MKKYTYENAVRDVRLGVKRNYQSVLVVIGFFLLWELAVKILKVPEFILPAPTSALSHLFFKQPDANYNWILHISTTAMEIGISFVVTAAVGILIAPHPLLVEGDQELRAAALHLPEQPAHHSDRADHPALDGLRPRDERAHRLSRGLLPGGDQHHGGAGRGGGGPSRPR